MTMRLWCNSRRRRTSNSNVKNSTNSIQKLNIDGFFFDSSAVAAILRGTDGFNDNDNSQRFQSREIIFRNVSIDATVLQGASELLRHRNISTFRGKTGKTKGTDHSTSTITNTNIDIIHCSGLVSELIRIVLPTTRRFGFAGNIPIAHNLDTEGLSVIGENLGGTGTNASVPTQTDDCNGDHRGDRNSAVRLKSLVLKGTRLESSGFYQFCGGLGINTTLEDLQMSNCILEEDDVLLLASALRKNRSLKSVFFASCKFGTKSRSPFVSQNNFRVETTQSLNNTYPQINLPIVLEAMVRHPTLESLNIYDMCCNEQAIQAIGNILSSTESKLRHLGLKNNLSHPHSKLPGVSYHLFRALSHNQHLTYLKISGNNLNDGNMIELGRILTESKTSIQTLSITDNLISHGLLPLASRLSDAKSLRYLDVLRNPMTDQSKKAMVYALKNNVQLERLDLDGSWDEEKFWWLNLNRGGRRALQASGKKNVPSSLWPTILERAYNIPLSTNSKQPSSTTNIEVVYYLIRRIPWLFEKASASTRVVRESKPEQKRQRKRVVKANCMEAEPKAKRKFNAY
jgi:hypothetical protein